MNKNSRVQKAEVSELKKKKFTLKKTNRVEPTGEKLKPVTELILLPNEYESKEPVSNPTHALRATHACGEDSREVAHNSFIKSTENDNMSF